MTDAQIHDAVKQMVSHCDLHMAEYNPLSARGTLYALGYEGEQAEEVLQAIYDAGFTYCLDPYHGDTKVSQDACYWGPDQLKSRLQCLRGFPRI